MNGQFTGAPPHRGGMTPIVTILAASVLLLYFVVTRSVSASLSPEMALRLQPNNGVALVDLAERSLLAEVTPARGAVAIAASQGMRVENPNSETDNSQTRTRLQAALATAPLNARALRILAQLDERSGPREQLLRLIAKLDIKESYAIDTLMHRAFESGDNRAAAKYADILLRTNSTMLPSAVRLLVAIAERPEGTMVVNELLAGDPPWRRSFFLNMLASITDARTPLALMQLLKASSTPPGEDELNRYLQFLVSKGFYQLAYYTWLQFLPADRLASTGFLFNGAFESPASGSPFDWNIATDNATVIDFAQRPDQPKKRALLLDMRNARVEFSVYQMIVLAPGSFRLHGKFMGNLVGKRGVRWRVTCAGGTLLGESAMIVGEIKGWVDFNVDFEVPAEGCKAQTVTLSLDSRSASEKFVSGSLSFAEMSIQPQRAQPSR